MKSLLRFIIGIILMGILIWFVDWKSTIDSLSDIKAAPVIFAFLVLNLNIFISSLKWKILINAKAISISWWELAKCYWISTFFGNYLPSSIGGDIVRLIMLKKLGQSAAVAASIVWERMTGFFILLGWSMIVITLKPDYFQIGNLWIFIWLLVISGIIALIAVVTAGEKLARLLDRIFAKRIGFIKKISSKVQKFATAVNEYRLNKRAIVLSLMLSIPFYSIGVICNYFIFEALEVNVRLLDIMIVLPIVYLVSLLPISLNGLGLSEGALVILFSQIGLPAHEALAAAVIRRVIHLLVSLIGGFLWIPSRTSSTSIHYKRFEQP
jgi:uncharacterized protein (TIRG00374 family)